MIGSKEEMVQRLVAHLQSRAEGSGMLAALDEAHEALREAARRVGHGSQPEGYVRGAYLTPEPIATRPRRR